MNRETEIRLQLQLQESALLELIEFYQVTATDSRPVYSVWTAHDVLCHLTSWHESFARNLLDTAQGRKARPFRGTLTQVNEDGVAALQNCGQPELLQRLEAAQQTIREQITSPNVTVIPYKQGSRPYPPGEHLDVVRNHIMSHLKDLRKIYR